MSYLGNLTLRLAAGAMQLPEDERRRQAVFLERFQTDDGGYTGRDGPADLYYSGFAVRALALVGELTEESARRTAEFLTARLADELSGVDYLSLVFTAVVLDVTHGIDVFQESGRDRCSAVCDELERFHCDDGGYAKTGRALHSSVYHTFLAMACRQLVGDELEDDQPRVAQVIRARQRDDGGFVELAPLKRSGTNPTAAAVGLLRLLDAVDEKVGRAAAEFLTSMQNAEGGLRANTLIPAADLLSTFTGLVALADLNALDQVDLPAVARYVDALEQPDGGFRGGLFDDVADVEYTFYGLGLRALLATVGK